MSLSTTMDRVAVHACRGSRGTAMRRVLLDDGAGSAAGASHRISGGAA